MLLLLTVGAADVPRAAESAAAVPNTSKSVPAPRRVNVEVLVLAPQDLTMTGSYVGDLQPNERVVLRSEAEGLVERVTFDDSDWVQRNQVLANIATDQAAVRRNQATVNLELAEATLTRNQALFDKQLIPPQVLDDSRTATDVARLNLQSAEIELRKTIIRSPLDGVVKTRYVSKGEFAQRGGLIAEVLDISVLIAKVNVPEREIGYFTEGKAVTVWLDAQPDRTFPGKVKTIGPEADAKSRNFPVEVAVDNRNRHLRAGMLARVKAELVSASQQIVIPRSAVLERESKRVVFVETQGAAAERAVDLGATANEKVQVLAGLKAGERLIVAGQTRIRPGEAVLVVRSLTQSVEVRP